MSSQGAESPVEVDELASCPLAGLRSGHRRPVQPDLMNQAIRKHRHLETHRSRNRCATVA